MEPSISVSSRVGVEVVGEVSAVDECVGACGGVRDLGGDELDDARGFTVALVAQREQLQGLGWGDLRLVSFRDKVEKSGPRLRGWVTHAVAVDGAGFEVLQGGAMDEADGALGSAVDERARRPFHPRDLGCNGGFANIVDDARVELHGWVARVRRERVPRDDHLVVARPERDVYPRRCVLIHGRRGGNRDGDQHEPQQPAHDALRDLLSLLSETASNRKQRRDAFLVQIQICGARTGEQRRRVRIPPRC